jgi:hypothetical protein
MMAFAVNLLLFAFALYIAFTFRSVSTKVTADLAVYTRINLSLPMRSSTLLKIYRRLNEVLQINSGLDFVENYGDLNLTKEKLRNDDYGQLLTAFGEYEMYRDMLRQSTRLLDFRTEVEAIWYVKNVTLRFSGNVLKNHSLYDFEDMLMAYQIAIVTKRPDELSLNDEMIWWLQKNSNNNSRAQMINNNSKVRSLFALVEENLTVYLK